MNIHSSKVANQPEKNAAFLAAFRNLMPAIRSEKFMVWWDALVRPTLDNLGQSKATVNDARAVVLSVLVYDEEDDRNGEKKKAAQLITERLFEIFLEKTKLLSRNTSAGFAEEERQRFVVQNVEAVLLNFGSKRPHVSVSESIVRVELMVSSNSSPPSTPMSSRKNTGFRHWGSCAAT